MRTAAIPSMLCDGMSLSARRLLALVALAAVGGAATAQAVAAPSDGKARAAAKKKQRPKGKAKARAVKLSGGVAWAPSSVLASTRAPLTGGTATGGGAAGGGTGASGDTGTGTGGTGTPGGPGTTTPTTPDTPVQQQALGVTVDERDAYTMVLSRTALTAGATVVQLNNIGEDPHNLRIVRTSPAGGGTVDFPDTDKQSRTTRTLTLAAGTYYLYCTLTTPTSHEQAGMHATLRVDP